MTPRTDMECFDLTIPYEENLEMIKRCKYTRYPVCREDKDHIEGFIHIKDLYWNDETISGTNYENLSIREITAVSESLSVDRLLQKMCIRDRFLIGIADLVGISNMISAYRVKTAEFNGIFQTAAVFVHNLQQGLPGICILHPLPPGRIVKGESSAYIDHRMAILFGFCEIFGFNINLRIFFFRRAFSFIVKIQSLGKIGNVRGKSSVAQRFLSFNNQAAPAFQTVQTLMVVFDFVLGFLNFL